MPVGIWKGSISFGLLNIPVHLKSVSQGKDLSFSMLDGRDMAPIKYKKINAKTGDEVPYPEIVKGYEFEPGHYVALNKKDFEAANPKATQTIDIEDFVLQEEIDPLLFDKPYYLVPQKNGEKGYFLLRDALGDTQKVAVGKIVIRTKQHLAMIMARGDYLILELLRFPHEIKEVAEADYLKGVSKKKVAYSDRELKVAEALIAEMTEAWKPQKYKDTYYDDVMKRINAKIRRGEIEAVEDVSVERDEGVPTADAGNVLSLLRRSLRGSTTKRKAG